MVHIIPVQEFRKSGVLTLPDVQGSVLGSQRGSWPKVEGYFEAMVCMTATNNNGITKY